MDQENGHTEITYLRSEDSSEDYVSKIGLEDISFTMNIKNEQVKGVPASPRTSVMALLWKLGLIVEIDRHYHRTCLS